MSMSVYSYMCRSVSVLSVEHIQREANYFNERCRAQRCLMPSESKHLASFLNKFAGNLTYSQTPVKRLTVLNSS